MKIEIPERMRHLKIDRRGYPIPYGVLIDDNGNPHFAINDHDVRQRTIANDLCGICGTRLFRGIEYWRHGEQISEAEAARHTHCQEVR